eukprot:TRINITY_DN3072_c0_g2_i1.p1 TRINITY_DN3072_c0_g2~~TRINITY_DN3072_c0_g2_i1.p1  ORF type:complete len:1261 (+),score=124.77 TRINITY_DN3072_c0_g2_i1:4888-8670(+)
MFDVPMIMVEPEPNELCDAIIYMLDTLKTIAATSVNLEQKLKETLEFLALYSNENFLSDKAFLGLLKVAEKLATHAELLSTDNRIKMTFEVFYNWLFPLREAERSRYKYKCKTAKSREAAYNLLIALTKANPGAILYLLKECLYPLGNQLTELTTWAYNSEKQERSQTGYVGIRNLGNICYLISMLQQFFCIPTFRNTILSLEMKGGADNLLYQLQVLFGYLSCSLRKDTSPERFCAAFKEQNGQPLNTAIQHDAHEFLNIFFDKMEQALKPTPYKNLLQKVFGGRVCSQVKCKSCGFVSSTYEDLYSLSLDIKNQKNLSDALARFIAGDTVSDYYCAKCCTKRDVTKRTLLSSLPNIMIIHLQRFTFNFDSLRNEKIHNRLEFPNDLNMYPFTVDGVAETEAVPDTTEAELKDSQDHDRVKRPKVIGHGFLEARGFQYKLVGVVVHNGNADAGHYYSYINVPREAKWVEFNDSVVSEFDFSKLQTECFGGTYEESDAGYPMEEEIAQLIQKRSKSAYMLFYEKVEKEDMLAISVNGASHEFFDERGDLDLKQQDKEDVANELQSLSKAPQKISTEVISEVEKDNAQYLYEKLVYSPEFISFISTIFYNSYHIVTPYPFTHELYQCLYSISHRMFIDLLPHITIPSSYIPFMETAGDTLTKLFSANAAVSRSLLDEFIKAPYKAYSLLILCPEQVVRQYIGKVLLSSFITCVSYETEIFNTTSIAVNNKGESETVYVATTRQFIETITTFIGYELSVNWMKFRQFFELLRDLIFAGGQPVVKYAFSKDLLSILLDFFLEKRSPLYSLKIKRYEMGNIAQAPDFGPLIELVAFLLQRVDFPRKSLNGARDVLLPPSTLGNEVFSLTELAKKCVLIGDIICKHLHCNGKADQIAELMVHLCYENKKYSVQVCQTLLQLMNTPEPQLFSAYLELIYKFVSIVDSYQGHRIEWTFGWVYPVAKGQFFTSSNTPTASDETNVYVSPIVVNPSILPLLALLWRHRDKYKPGTLECISMIMKLVKEQKELYIYLKNVPSPNYIYGRYTDWVKEFLESYDSEVISSKALEDAKELFKEYEERIKHEKAVEPQQYVIGKILDIKQVKKLERTVGEVRVMFNEVYAEIYPAIPEKDRKIAAVNPEYLQKHEEKLDKPHIESISSPSTASSSQSTKESQESVKSTHKVGTPVLRVEVVNGILLQWQTNNRHLQWGDKDSNQTKKQLRVKFQLSQDQAQVLHPHQIVFPPLLTSQLNAAPPTSKNGYKPPVG